jgi:chromosome segregation ATPase
MEEAAQRHQVEREAADRAAAKALDDHKAQHERALAVAHGEVVRTKAVADAEHGKAIAAIHAEHERQRKEAHAEHERQRKEAHAEYERQRKDTHAEHARIAGELTTERDELRRGLSSARDSAKRNETELASAVQTIADRNAELRAHAAAVAERDQRIAELRREIEGVEHENASYQEQVLRAYQKIKADEAMVARAKKAMAIALTVLDDQGNPKADPT